MTVIVFSAVYLVAVAGDHLSTLIHMDRGAYESNILFQAADGSLTQGRAIAVFVLLWPLLVGALWVGRRRAAYGDAAVSHPLMNAFIGRTAFSALFVPVIVIVAKSVVTLLNLANLVLPVSTSRLLKRALEPHGLWSPVAGYFITAAAILLVSYLVSRPPVRRWADRLRAQLAPRPA